MPKGRDGAAVPAGRLAATLRPYAPGWSALGALRAIRRRLDSSRLVVVGLVVTLVLGTAGFLIGRGDTGLRLLVRPGDAWLPTNTTGSVTLVDGLSGRATAQLVIKGANGHKLLVSQVGGQVLVLDATTGLLVRVNPAQLLLGASTQLAPADVVVPGVAATYLVNDSARSVQRIDPVTLAQLGPTVALPWQPAAGAVVDGSGTLWLPVPSIGSVVPVTASGRLGRPVRVSAVGADVVMTSAGGVPIAVDRTARRVTAVSLAGARSVVTLPASASSPLLVPSASAGGTPSSLAMLNPNGSPSLVIVNLSQGTSRTASLGAAVAGDRLGAPVQSGPRVFIPDYTTGEVLLYDTTVGTVSQAIPVLGHPGVFTAQVIDGIAYFNDPNGNRAVVVTPDGVVHEVSKVGPHLPTARHAPPPPLPPPNPGPAGPGGTGPPPVRHHHKPKPTRPPAPPLAPVNPQATPGAGVVSLTWQRPGSGGPVTGYQVTISPGGTQRSTGSTSLQITGLTCGTTYSFTISSVGADGKRVPAAPVSAMPCVPPSTPQGLTWSVSSGQIALAWSAPASPGGGTVSYTVAVGGGSPTPVSGTSDTITGLANFQTYSVAVTATSQAGPGGVASASVNLSAGPWGGYSTNGSLSLPLNVRSGPSVSTTSVYQIPPGTSIPVTIICQISGGYYQDPTGSPSGTIWDKVSFSGGTGYIADGYVNTTNSQNNQFSPPIFTC